MAMTCFIHRTGYPGGNEGCARELRERARETAGVEKAGAGFAEQIQAWHGPGWQTRD